MNDLDGTRLGVQTQKLRGQNTVKVQIKIRVTVMKSAT